MKRLTFTAYDGKTISYVEWSVDSPKAIVLIAHGMCEHILRYSYIAEKLNEQGYLVIGDDHRGHGETDKETFGYSDGNMYKDTLKDMAKLCKIYSEKYPKLNIILFSHSYGSFLAQRFIEKYHFYISGVILGGSASMSGVLPYAGGVVAWLGCTFKGKDKPAKLLNSMTFESYKKQLKKDSFISTIESEAKRYDDDPYCGFICSYNFYRAFFKGLREIYKKKNLQNLNKDLPMLIISGKDDPVGGFGKLTEKLYKTYKEAGVKDVTLKLYDGVLHEFLNDVSREEATSDIISFCDKVVEAYSFAKHPYEFTLKKASIVDIEPYFFQD